MVSKHRGNRTRQPRKASVPRLRTDTLRMLRSEARNLGLTTEEYMRMVLNLSSTLRQGLVDEGQVDGRKLLQWVDNPLMLSVVQWICRYALKSMETATDDTSDSGTQPSLPKTETELPAPSPSRPMVPQGQRPARVWLDPWGNVIQGPPPRPQSGAQPTAPQAEPDIYEEGFF